MATSASCHAGPGARHSVSDATSGACSSGSTVKASAPVPDPALPTGTCAGVEPHASATLAAMADVDAETLRRSVVKLFTVVKEPNYYKPWELSHQHASGGSACIVEGNRILTNAHVVAHQLYVQALKPGDTRK